MKAVQNELFLIGLLVAIVLPPLRAAWAIDDSIPAIHGDVSRTLLGDGTGVIIGYVDSGIDDTHPALAGNDSLGNPRLVAEQNFVSAEPANTGDDVFGHGTWVSSVALSGDAVYKGFAPDARYVNARVLNSSNFLSGSFEVMNGIGFAVGQGSQVINLSLNFSTADSNGLNSLDRMLDWAAYSQGISISVSSGNIAAHVDAGGNIILDGPQEVRSPGSLFNGVSVGRTTSAFDRVHVVSTNAPTADGRVKPDVVAPGTLMTLANDDWETGPQWETNAPTGSTLNGTSFSAAHVAGMMAQQIDYGQSHGLSVNPLVVKATLMNSAVKLLDKQGNIWEPRASSMVAGVLQVTSPLDTDAGAGQIDGLRLYQQYSAGEQGPGTVNPIGWDLNTIVGVSSLDYAINGVLPAGSLLDVTLDWFRHVLRTDNGDGIINGSDSFLLNEPLDNLDLTVLLDGLPIARSMSSIDNVEQLHLTLPQTGTVTLRVDRLDVAGSGTNELYGLAWNIAVPEPAAIVLAMCGLLAGGLGVLRSQRRRHNNLPNFAHVRL